MTTTPPQRRFSDLPTLSVPCLSTAEQFVVGVCRCWDAFMSVRDPQLAHRLLGPVFAYMDVRGALCAFESAFMTLHEDRARPIRFREADCRSLGADEARMLSTLASLQRFDTRAATALLHAFLTRAGVRAILPPLARIAGCLAARGHSLPSWHDIDPGCHEGI